MPCLLLLFLLDQSAALNMVDHAILPRPLEETGIKGFALNWFMLLLTDRVSLVSHHGGICLARIHVFLSYVPLEKSRRDLD